MIEGIIVFLATSVLWYFAYSQIKSELDALKSSITTDLVTGEQKVKSKLASIKEKL